MLIICPNCSTAYRIEVPSLGASGRQVRCARCRTMWVATAESAVPATLDAEPPRRDDSRSPAAPADAADEFGEWQTGGTAEADTVADVATADAPSLVPAQGQGAPAAAIESDREDIESIAARRARPAQRSARRRLTFGRPGLPAAILVLAAVIAALVNWRATVVRLVPQTAPLFAMVGMPVNLRGLTFEALKSTQEFQDGMTVLIVEGTIVNVTRAGVDVPRLRFALRNPLGQEVYAWTALPDRPTLGPQDRLPFRTRLASPPSDGRDVVVRFFTRHDLIAGGQR
jgi:predicted Zn finger-like uncharacterized protein